MHETKMTRCLMNEWKKLDLGENGILRSCTGEYVHLVLPKQFYHMVYHELHKEMGQLTKQRFCWPYMQQDIQHHITNVCSCLKQKCLKPHPKVPLQNLTSTAPFELISIDFVHLEKSKDKYEYILVVIDHFIRFAQVYATHNKSV